MNYGKHQPPPATTPNILAGPQALWKLELFKVPVRTKFDIQSFEQVKPFLDVCKSGGVCVCVCVCVHERVRACTFFATPWAAACQAPLSVEFSRQEYWRGLPFLLPRGLADPGIEPVSPESSALTGEFFTTVSSGRPCKSGLVDILDT